MGSIAKAPEQKLTATEFKDISRSIKASVKEAGIKQTMTVINAPGCLQITFSYIYKMKKQFSEAVYKREVKNAIKKIGLKPSGVNNVNGPGTKFIIEVKQPKPNKENKMKIQLPVSTSATKKQEANAKILFGKKATKVLNALTLYSKEKLLKTEGIDIVLASLKTKDTEKLEKFSASAGGKQLASKALALANAKSLTAVFKAVKELKAPAALKRLVGSQPVKPTAQPAKSIKSTRVPPKALVKRTRPTSIEVFGIPMDSQYVSSMPVSVMNMLQGMITPALAKKVTKAAKESEGVSLRGLGYAKIKKLIDAFPSAMKETDSLPDWVRAEEDGSVTVFGVKGTGEVSGFYSPGSKRAEIRIAVMNNGFRSSGIVSIES